MLCGHAVQSLLCGHAVQSLLCGHAVQSLLCGHAVQSLCRTHGIQHGMCECNCAIHCNSDRIAYPRVSNQPVLLLLLDFAGTPRTYHWCNRWWTLSNVERPLVQHYGLPVASYRDAVWPIISKPRPDLPCFWNGLSHPDVATHLLVADVVTYALVNALVQSHNSSTTAPSNGSIRATNGAISYGSNLQCSGDPVRFHQKQQGPKYCPLPTPNSPYKGVYMSVADAASFKPIKASSSWQYRTERRQKSGAQQAHTMP
jgi:hypothetical protein